MSEQNERSIWELVDAVAVLFTHASVAARARAFGHPLGMVRVLAQRDHAYSDSVLLERELAIFRSQRQGRRAKQRPYYAPKQRAEILHLMRLRGWSANETASRFVVHPNTIRYWKRALRDKYKGEDLVGAPPWNGLKGSGGLCTRSGTLRRIRNQKAERAGFETGGSPDGP